MSRLERWINNQIDYWIKKDMSDENIVKIVTAWADMTFQSNVDLEDVETHVIQYLKAYDEKQDAIERIKELRNELELVRISK